MGWKGASDSSRNVPAEYFIPKSLLGDFARLTDFLTPFVTEERLARFRNVSKGRSRFVVPVFENTHHTHNVSAILRTCDALGFQDAYFCYHDTEMRFRLKDSVERGSSTWLSPRRAGSIERCAGALKASGYAIALVSLPTFYTTAVHYVEELPSFAAQEMGGEPFERARAGRGVALVFGNEKAGVSPEWTEHADFYVHVDMHGFVESLNVSVCAGVLLHALRTSLEGRERRFLVAEHEAELLVEHWMARSVTNGTEVVRDKQPGLWPWFDFVRKGMFFDPFDDISPGKRRATL